jgi:hypothetical protein
MTYWELLPQTDRQTDRQTDWMQDITQAETPDVLPTPWPTPFWPETSDLPALMPDSFSTSTDDLILPDSTPEGFQPLPTPSVMEAPIVVESLSERAPAQAQESVAAASLWMAPGAVRMALPAQAGEFRLGELPLTLRNTTDGFGELTTITAEVLEPDLAASLSPVGIAFSLTFSSADDNVAGSERSLPSQAPLSLTLDYSRFAHAFGGSFAERIVLYRASGCQQVISAERSLPEVTCSRVDALPGENDLIQQRLTVTLNAEPGEATVPEREGSEFAAPAQEGEEIAESEMVVQLYLPAIAAGQGQSAYGPDDGDTYYVVASATGSQQGDYKATPFSSVKDLQVSLSSGSAQTSYPIPLPPPAAGPAPSVALNYDSGSVDGMHSSKNNQPGLVGLGWSLESGYIVHHLKSCNLVIGGVTIIDLCATDQYSIVLNGRSSRLVATSTANLYKLQDDPYWRVQRLVSTNSNHPDWYRPTGW